MGRVTNITKMLQNNNNILEMTPPRTKYGINVIVWRMLKNNLTKEPGNNTRFFLSFLFHPYAFLHPQTIYLLFSIYHHGSYLNFYFLFAFKLLYCQSSVLGILYFPLFTLFVSNLIFCGTNYLTN